LKAKLQQQMLDSQISENCIEIESVGNSEINEIQVEKVEKEEKSEPKTDNHISVERKAEPLLCCGKNICVCNQPNLNQNIKTRCPECQCTDCNCE